MTTSDPNATLTNGARAANLACAASARRATKAAHRGGIRT